MKKGFTLVELLVVMTIIATLAFMGVMQYVSFKFRTQVRVDASNAKLYTNGIMFYESVKQKPYTFQDQDQMFKDFKEVGFIVDLSDIRPQVDPTGSWVFDKDSYRVRAKINIDDSLFDKIGDNDKMYFDND